MNIKEIKDLCKRHTEVEDQIKAIEKFLEDDTNERVLNIRMQIEGLNENKMREINSFMINGEKVIEAVEEMLFNLKESKESIESQLEK